MDALSKLNLGGDTQHLTSTAISGSGTNAVKSFTDILADLRTAVGGGNVEVRITPKFSGITPD